MLEQNEPVVNQNEVETPKPTTVEASLALVNEFIRTDGVTCACLIFVENGCQIHAVGDTNSDRRAIRWMVRDILQVMGRDEPFQLRVIEEANDLEVKLNALNDFLKRGHGILENEHQEELLQRQRNHMEKYLRVLRERIEGFRVEEGHGVSENGEVVNPDPALDTIVEMTAMTPSEEAPNDTY